MSITIATMAEESPGDLQRYDQDQAAKHQPECIQVREISCGKRTANECAKDTTGTQDDRQAMAFVVDPDYNPIAYASIGTNNLLTDRNGVAIGEIIPNKAG